MGINYHSGKASVVADALSRRSHAYHLIVKNILIELWRWKLVQVYFKRFVRLNWKMRRSKTLNITSKNRSPLVFQKMLKECCGIKEGFVCLTSRT
jgi:hypothetical protein